MRRQKLLRNEAPQIRAVPLIQFATQRDSRTTCEKDMPKNNRWAIAAAGFLMQMVLGAVYAWSVFRVPPARQFHRSIEEVTLTFTISIFVLSFACSFGGLWLNKTGPRTVALTGGFLYGLGVFLASFSAHGLWWLYASYGVIGGIGDCAGSDAPHSERRRLADIRLSRRRVSRSYHGHGLLHAESARRLEAGRHSPDQWLIPNREDVVTGIRISNYSNSILAIMPLSSWLSR
jgi:hypothetical protein